MIGSAGRVARQVVERLVVLFTAVVVAGLVLQATGFASLDVLGTITASAFGSVRGLTLTLRWTVPLVLVGLSVAISFRAGLFNIGAQGQFLVGAFAAILVGLYLPAPRLVVIGAACFAAAGAGALWGALAGVLRAWYGTNEVVSTVMLNFIALHLTNYLVRVPFNAPEATGQVLATRSLGAEQRLPSLTLGPTFDGGLLVALGAAVLVAIYVRRTPYGFEERILGGNPFFAEYAGLRPRVITVRAFAVSGALAGLAGAVEILGPVGRFVGGFSADLGLTAVVVALMGGLAPAGVVAAAAVFGGLESAAQQLRLLTDVPRAVVVLLKGVIMLFVTAQAVTRLVRLPRRRWGPDRGDTLHRAEVPEKVAP